VNWRVYGTNGWETAPAGLVIENYPRRGPDDHPANAIVKSIVYPRFAYEVTDTSVHYFRLRGNPVGEDRRPALQPRRNPGSADLLRINHYYAKSEEEFRRKSACPRADTGTIPDRLSASAAAAGWSPPAPEVEDDSIIQFAPQLKTALAARFALGGAVPELTPVRTSRIRRVIGLSDSLFGRLALAAQRRREEGVIALYHRIAPEPNLIYPPLHPDEFDKHCSLLKQWFTVLPLSELLELHGRGRSLAGLCSITFDDGYRDFLEHALPALDAHGLSATQFVITDCVASGQPPWDLRLLRITLCAPDGGDCAALLPRLNAMPPADRDRWLRQRESELPPTGPLHQLPQMLRASDLADISAGSADLGSHTVSHRMLADVDLDTARAELTDSLAWLQDKGRDISVVAYPKGSVTHPVMDLAQEAGYQAGLAVSNRGIDPRSERFRLPRVDITDRPVRMLRMELAGTTERLRRLRSPRGPRVSSRASAG
jgi:peptidoglycan/xylan/chitin deacetylase (PgdA/CDA1 family)